MNVRKVDRLKVWDTLKKSNHDASLDNSLFDDIESSVMDNIADIYPRFALSPLYASFKKEKELKEKVFLGSINKHVKQK